MRNMTLVLVLAIVLLLSTSAHARSVSSFASYDDPSVSTFGLSYGYMTGMTLYHISSYDITGSGIESELEFPLNTFLLSLEGSYRGAERAAEGRVQFDYRLSMNLGGGSGKMKDSDWLTDDIDIFLVGSPNPGLDIYSESDADLKAMIIDLRLSYDTWAAEQWAVGPLVGLRYEKFSYDVSNVSQVGYGPYAAGYTGSMSGLVLTYEVSYTVPLVGIRTTLHTTDAFEAQLDLGYSPWVSAKDKDDHLLRYKLSEASTSGSAFLAALTGQWETSGRNFIQCRGEYFKIETTGTQNQRFYAGPYAGDTFSGINDRIDSEQFTVSLVFTALL
jgi:outer membrane protease